MPRRKKLSLEDYEALLAQYKSDERLMEFQLAKTKETIKELEKATKTAKKEAASAKPKKRRGPGRPPKAKKTESASTKPKRGPGRPKKAKSAKAADSKPKRGPGRPKKAKSAKAADSKPKRGPGRPPKTTKAATAAKKPKTKAKASDVGYRLNDLDELIIDAIRKKGRVMINAELFDRARKKFPEGSDASLRGKINRSLHKLANKHGRLVKASYPGKGHSYGLIDWKEDSGDVAEKYQYPSA